MDDILTFSDDPLEHKEHVKKVLERLGQAGLQVDIKKSSFSVKSSTSFDVRSKCGRWCSVSDPLRSQSHL